MNSPRRKPRILARVLHKVYKLTLSRLTGDACRFYPYCSDYALEAVERHGWFTGGWLACKRLMRCHPWHPGGHDPVP